MHLGRLFVACAALTLGALACPSSRPDIAGPDAGSDDAPSVLAADSYCEQIADFFCGFYLRCGRMAVTTAAECEAQFLETCNARFEPSYVALVDAGLLALSAAGVETCRAHLEQVACDQQLRDLDGPCAAMWLGAQPEGAACGFDVESFVCAPGTACVLGTDLCGICERVVADGEGCADEDVTCGRDSFCTDVGVCAARRRPGDACGEGDRCLLGASCDDDGLCAAPAVVQAGDACDLERRCPYGSVCVGGICARTAPLGAACSDTTLCHSGFCAPADDAASSVCAPLLAQGAPCEASSQCQTGACLDGRCRSLPGACFPTDVTDAR